MRRAHLASAALPALALLLAAAAAAPADHCTRLAKENDKRRAIIGERSVSVDGQQLSVALYWGSDPARAASALLLALLRHVRLYRDVRLVRGEHATARLASSVPFDPAAAYNDLVIGLSTAWQPTAARSWKPSAGETSGLAGPRLYEFDVSPVAARCRLFAWVARRARKWPECCRHMHWEFIHTATGAERCGFHAVANQSNEPAVEVVAVEGVGATCNASLLQERVAVPLHIRHVSRAVLRTLQTSNQSFVFLDYDIWESEPGVTVVKPPPCVPLDSDCQELDSTIAMRVGDVEILRAYASLFFKFVHDFNPTPTSIRFILDQEANGVDIEQAACEFALQNKSYIIPKTDLIKYDLFNYTVAIYLCDDDPDNDTYDKMAKILGIKISKQTLKIECIVNIRRYFIDCSAEYHMSKRLDVLTSTENLYSLLGVVSLAVEGAAATSVMAAARRVPLWLADVVPEEDPAAAVATWRVAGRPRHIARALHHFVLESGWTRLAVVSQPTQLATDHCAALKDMPKIIIREFPIPSNLTKRHAEKTLQELKDKNARIIFINADSDAAVTILAAAVESGMSYTDGFVWIVREWRQNNVECGTKYFTVSFWIRGPEDIPSGEGRGQILNQISTPWPRYAVSLANALLSLINGFTDVIRQYPNMRRDLHSNHAIRSLTESLIKTPVTGVSRLLHYKERSIEEIFVFVDEWCGGDFKRRLVTWRVNASSDEVRGKSGGRANYTRPADMPRDDGTSSCIVRSGDQFDPYCYDTASAFGLLLLVLVPAAVLLARRMLRRHIARLKQQQQIEVIARRRHVATMLAAYLVERESLELREEIGAGRFGSVRLALLRTPGHNPRFIAAKALRENAAPAEESEFLREACTIASLDHAHIVRLVGVCIADGPPLVLMELAFFGDLLGYLRARRHLAEGSGSEEVVASGEAEHVSAEALTRLAREAAEALQYLSVRGVVHRDVRAANCLVDVRRSLKLADFGMARDTVAGADGAPEYACRRRGLFPVLWMAPESLEHGVFSAASDVWSFGVLLLELVTLGARPYGSMSPLRVLEYVAAGGSPPLPLDVMPQTRGLAQLCWQRAPERRPSAAEVADYLAAWPLALQPALLSVRGEPADADSGFGESPSTELLPPDSPFHSLDQLEGLAATRVSNRSF